MSMSEAKKWIAFHHPVPRAACRLFCFPYAGGGAHLFRSWPGFMPAGIEILPVQLPGRGNRIKEAPYVEMMPLIRDLAMSLRPYFADKPFAFFGHSMGALLSFELARYLRRHDGIEPVYLFVSGRRAPRSPRHGTLYHQLPEAELLAELRAMNGTPCALLEDAEFMRLMLPMLRADFALCEKYACREQPSLDCALSAFGGAGDPLAGSAEIEAWRHETTGPFKLRILPGDHFFVNSHGPQLAALLGEDLSRTLNSPPAGETSSREVA